MVVLRCTARLQKRLRLSALSESGPSTTILGDWYGNIFHVGRRPLIILTSEKSLLTVLLPARDLGYLAVRFSHAVRDLLLRIGIPGDAVARELAQMAEVHYGPTASRSVLGTMNDFVTQVKFVAPVRPEVTLQDFEDHFAHTPCSPLGYLYPMDLARKLLAPGEPPTPG